MKQEEASRPSIQSEELFRLVAENVEDFAIFAIDLEGNAASWNPGVEKLLGYSEPEWLGRNACDIFTPEDNERDVCRLEMRMARENDRAIDQRWHVRKDGTRFWANGLVMALRDDAGRLRGFTKIMRDETERWAVEEDLRRTKARLESALEAGLAGTFYWDLPRNRVITDENMKRYFSLSEQATGEGVTLEEVLPAIYDKDRQSVAQALTEAVESTGLYQLEYRVNHGGGGVRWLSARGRAERNEAGKVIGLPGFAVDITERKEAEEALKESEERYRSLVSVLTSIVWTVDPEGRFVTPQPSWEAYTGQPWEEHRDFGWTEAVHPDDRARLLASWEEAKRARAVYKSEGRLWHAPTGEYRWFFARAVPLTNADGEVREWIGTVTDVHERKQAEEAAREAAERFRFLAESMPQKIFTARPSGEVDYFNRQWTEFTGLSFDEIRDWGWTQFIHPDDVDENVRRWQHSIDTGEQFQLEHRFRRADGEYRWHLSRAHAMRDSEGRVLMWIGSNTDIDDVKRAVEERERLLLREHEAREEAERANSLKDEFLATLSHELRTPLTAILGWARMLQANDFDKERARQALETIERSARTQAQLIDDLLDVSRIITGKLRLDVRAVDLPTVVTAAADTLRPAAEAKNIRLQILLDPQAGPISGDPDRLQQVVWNLVSNAIKFTPKGGRVQVRLERVNSHLEITVADTGVGIAPEFLPHVFDRFRQADQTTTRTHGGLGLGLAIVRQLVELHGGTVHVESRGEEQGATFTVSLPLLPVRAERRADEGMQRVHPKAHTGSAVHCPPELNGLHVLVVDDEPDTRDLLAAVLTNCGARVTQAGSAAEALELLERERFDVLVSDVGMPEEDGYSLIRKVRTLPPEHGGRTPAAALTAYAREEDRIQALLAGFQIHVPKPVGPNELAAVVANLAGRTGAV